MGLLRLLFRVAKKSRRRTTRRTSVVITSKQTAKRATGLRSAPTSKSSKFKRSTGPHPTPASETSKISSTKDVELIQALPSFRVEHVIDGDTVIVSSTSSQVKIRLDSIDCPENGQEWGDIATRGLIKLIGGKSVNLEAHGNDIHDRMLGTLFVYLQEKGEWQNVNERMVTLGHAWVMRLYYGHLPKQRQQKLNQLERWAKSKSVGLWKTDSPIPPWEWRKS